MAIASLIERPSVSDGPADFLGRILRAVRTHLGMAVAFISEFSDGRRVFRQVDSAEGSQCVEVGGSDPLEQSYCHWIAQGKLPRLMRNPIEHPLAASMPVTAELPVGAHLSVPITLRDGRIYGTFCCFSHEADPSLSARDLATLEAFAEVAREQIQDGLDREFESEQMRERIRSVIDNEEIEIVYQPAIRLDSPRVEFLEALARFSATPYEPPDRWFAAASRVGLGEQLQMLAVRIALDGLAKLPDGSSVSVNISAEAILSDAFATLMASAPVASIVLEITEHEAVASYSQLIEVLEPLRAAGLRLAVDDTGAGYSSFRHILSMRPDIIKLDMSLARDIDSDPARRALAAALINFAREIGSDLVAEGVETTAELQSLRELGVAIIQGYILARPSAPRRLRDKQLAIAC